MKTLKRIPVQLVRVCYGIVDVENAVTQYLKR